MVCQIFTTRTKYTGANRNLSDKNPMKDLFLLIFPFFCSFLRAPACFENEQEKAQKKRPKTMLECHVSVTKFQSKRYANELGRMVIEIKNTSKKKIGIPYYADPILDHVTFALRTPNGKTVKFRPSLSPIYVDPRTWWLEPGQTYKPTQGVAPIGAVGPGEYKIQVFFEYEKLKAVSPVLEVELKPIKK